MKAHATIDASVHGTPYTGDISDNGKAYARGRAVRRGQDKVIRYVSDCTDRLGLVLLRRAADRLVAHETSRIRGVLLLL